MVAAANVTGNYFRIVGSAVPAGLTPRIRVTLSAPATTADEVVSTVTQEFTPNSSGAFTLPLIPSDQMRPSFGNQELRPPHYEVAFDAADASGNFRTQPETFTISVPTGGGEFMDLVDAPAVIGWLEVTTTGPQPPSAYGPGVLILDTSGDLPFLSYTV